MPGHRPPKVIRKPKHDASSDLGKGKANDVLQRTYGGTGAAAVAHARRAMGATQVLISPFTTNSGLLLGTPFAPGS